MTPISIEIRSNIRIELEEIRFGRVDLCLAGKFGRRRGKFGWSFWDMSRFEEEVDPGEGGDGSSVHGGVISLEIGFEGRFLNQMRVIRGEGSSARDLDT